MFDVGKINWRTAVNVYRYTSLSKSFGKYYISTTPTAGFRYNILLLLFILVPGATAAAIKCNRFINVCVYHMRRRRQQYRGGDGDVEWNRLRARISA